MNPSPNARRASANAYLRTMMLVAAVLLPTASLVVLGSLWLWQHGYLVPWAVAAALFSTAIYAIQAFALRDLLQAPSVKANQAVPPFGDEREVLAWADVSALARTIKPVDVGSRDDALRLALRTVETVAKRMHPTDKARC
jgi:uncharacterized protein